MSELLTTVTLAAGAGVAAFFSPCAYALLPGYVSYYVAATESSARPVGGATVRGVAAGLGVVAAFGVLSVLAVFLGSALEPVFPWLEAVVGISLVVLGGIVLVRGGFQFHVPLPQRRTSVLGFGLFGALYAVAAAGCVAPLFLAVVFQSLTLSPVGAVATFAAFAGVFSVLLVSVTILTALGRDIGVGRIARFEQYLISVAGTVLVIAGLGQLGIAIWL